MLIILSLTISLVILTVAVYRLFLKNKIKNKKAVLSFLKSTYNIVFWAILYCTVINLILALIIEFATTTETSGATILQGQFIAYCIPLIVPNVLMFCLKLSIEKEEL